MRLLKVLIAAGTFVVSLAAADPRVLATDYFVSKQGSDTRSGTDRASAWATIQKGIDSLQPGDTLTICPGEYAESIKRTGLGDADHETLVRAEIPGTVLLRGDILAPAFHELPGQRLVSVADFDFAGEVPVVNEIDTLTMLKRMPNAAELEFVPGTFFHDAAAKKLYIATSDLQPAKAHHYSVSVNPTHGIYFVDPKRVVIDGLAVTGFSAMRLPHYREGTAGGIWGIFLVSAKSCVIRNCQAYLNAWGIGSNSAAIGSGDNIIEHCTAWGNASAFANGDMGGLTLFSARRDVIRDSTAYRNGMYGINIYGTGGAPPGGDDGGNDPKNRSLLAHNLAWGNETADFKIKTGYEYFHTIENCAGPGLWSATHVIRGLSGKSNSKNEENSIVLESETGLDPRNEFADPDRFDYRLQGTSRFRGTGADGQDRGPFPFQPNVFYVSRSGDDQADGLSWAHAWKSFDRAASALRPGAALYLGIGVSASAAELHLQGTKEEPITIRGTDLSFLDGPVRISNSTHVTFERVHFQGAVIVERSGSIAFNHCHFRVPGGDIPRPNLEASGTRGLTISHCIFPAIQKAAVSLRECSEADLRGNLFNNSDGVALQLTSAEGIRYSNYNSFPHTATAWEVQGQAWKWADVQKIQEQQSKELVPAFISLDLEDRPRNETLFAAAGPLGKSIGPYEDRLPSRKLSLVSSPTVHSVSATTANLEWMTSMPATCHLAWGETPACDHSATFNVNCFGTYSLTGLNPGHTYYFRINKIEVPKDLPHNERVETAPIADDPISFTTLDRNPAPITYFVAPDGDDTHAGTTRQAAWKTIRRAAEKVNAGDTVMVAGGTYPERVRLRATGEQGSPITFRNVPGERVNIDGNGATLPNAFIAGGKSHLRFDGFYFANFNLFPNDQWSLLNGGEFQLYGCNDVTISRCFSEGRGGYSAIPIAAYHVENLTIRNCVNTYKFGGMYFWRCPNLLIENTVFALPMINSFVLRNEKDQAANMRNCVFTDMLEKKAKLNIGLLCCDGAMDAFHHHNNAYFLRCFPPEERALNGAKPIGQLGDHIHEPLFADPQFAGDPGLPGHPEDKSGFGPDRMMEPALKLDFDSFFSTNPELVQRGIGLQPEAFADFKFARPPSP